MNTAPIKITVTYKSDANGNHFVARYVNPGSGKQVAKSKIVRSETDPAEINTSFNYITSLAETIRKEFNKDYPGRPVIVDKPKSGQAAIAYRKRQQADSAKNKKASERRSENAAALTAEIDNHTNKFIERFGHIGKARALLNAIVRNHGVDKLLSIYEDFGNIVRDIEDEQKEIAKAEAEKRLKAVKLVEMMNEQGITLADLADEKTTRLVKVHQQQKAQERVERNIKQYSLLPEGNKFPITWDGNGTMPQAMQDYLLANQDKRIEDLLV